MYSLRLFGGASLHGPEGPLSGRAAQRRRLALLALLATSRSYGVSREKLAAYLWPEHAAERARHLLRDSIYVLKRALGDEAILGVADEVRLNFDVVTCDARDFEQALIQQDLAQAVELYRGPFLDGFFLDEAADFERWAAAEREGFAQLYAGALEAVAEEQSQRGERFAAVESWRRLAAHDPYSSRFAIGLMDALHRSGDPAAALRQARIHATLLREEYGTNSPEVEAAVERIRTAATTSTAKEPAHDEPAAASPSDAVAPSRAAADARRPPRRLIRAARISALVVLAAAIVAIAWLGRTDGAIDEEPAIAVLPFVNLSGDSGREHIGDGLAEELIARLGQVEGLRVVSRTSAFAFRERRSDIRDIGRRLGVSSVLEGSVRHSGDRLRVSVQLIDVDDGYQRWAESYDRSSRDIFLIQDEIAQSVVGALRRRLGPWTTTPIHERRSESVEAYDYYLRGRFAWHQRTESSLLVAAAAFDSALALDPRFALAHAGLADAYAVLGFYGYLAPAEAFPRAKQAALRAVELDPALAEPHASLGYVALYYDWDWDAAEAAFRRSIERNPGYSVAHQWYANHLTARGRFREAEREMRLAQEIDPLSRIASAALCWVYYHARRGEAAVAQCEQTLALDPRFELAHLWKGWALEMMQRPEEAIRPLRRAVELSKGSPITRAAFARALALSGSREAAELILTELESEQGRYVPPYDLAKVHLALGRPDSAIALLRLALSQRAHSMAFLMVDPQLDELRDDPRFVELTGQLRPIRR